MEVKNLYITVGDEMYINIPALYKLNADVYIVFGERSAGKTYSVLKGIFDEYQKTGGQFVYMRTREDYIKGGRARGAVANIKGYVEKTLWKSEADLDYYVGSYRKKEIGRSGKWVYTNVGYTMTIGAWSKYKGNGYDDVTTIFLDEFIEDTDTRTIIPLSRDEFIKGWVQNLSTIIRRRTNVKVVACANSLNPKSPLFYYYNIDARKLKQGTVYLFNRKIEGSDSDLKICVLYTEPPKRTHVDKHLAVYDSETSEMTLNGAWQESEYPYKTSNVTANKQFNSKSQIVNFKDLNLSVAFPHINGLPMAISSRKFKGLEITTKDIYLPSCHRIAQMMYYYKQTEQIVSTDKVASDRFNDLIRRITIDKN